MKKSLLFLMALLLLPISATWAVEKALINFPTKNSGTSISGTTVAGTITVDGISLNCYTLKNGYSSNGEPNGNHIKLTLEGGFKTGDVITVAGCVSSGDNSKRGTVVVFKIGDSNNPVPLNKFNDFADLKGSTPVTELEEQSYTLEEDVEELYLGRDGNTGTNVTVIRVTRDVEEDPSIPEPEEGTVGYTEEINGSKLNARVLNSPLESVTISGPLFGSSMNNYAGTSKTVYIDNTSYTNTDSWRKSGTDYTNQYVGYKLSVASGCKMNVAGVHARIAVADDTYDWYVEILNGSGTQVWKSDELTTKKSSSAQLNAVVDDKAALQGLTGDITVNLYVKQGGSTKYFSINYLTLDVSTEPDSRPSYTMTVSQNIEEAGEVLPSNGAQVTEGESVAFTAKPATGYKFVKWEIDGAEVTDNPYTIENVDAPHTAVAYFAARYKVTYNLGEDAGTVTKVLNNVNEAQGYDEVYANDNNQYTIPAYAHKYLYKEGYIFDGWTDEDDNFYNSGDVINLVSDIQLSPIYIETTQTLATSPDVTVVTWSLLKKDVLYVDWQSASEYGYQTQFEPVNDEYISIPMKITGGKLSNHTRTANAQTNKNTTFTIPAVSGMKVEISDAAKAFETTTIAGSTDYQGKGTTSISYIYEGDDETIDIIIGEDNQYLVSIVVTYPAITSESVEIKLNKYGLATFYYSESAYTIPDGINASAVESITGNKINLTAVNDIIPAGCAVILEGIANETYIFEPTDEAGTAPTNLLRGSDEEATTTGDFEGESYIFYALSAKNGVAGFYWLEEGGAAFTNAPHKAYLAIKAESTSGDAPSCLTFNVADGIQNITVAEPNGAAFNLSGQRVDDAYKGVVIINGVKVIRK